MVIQIRKKIVKEAQETGVTSKAYKNIQYLQFLLRVILSDLDILSYILSIWRENFLIPPFKLIDKT